MPVAPASSGSLRALLCGTTALYCVSGLQGHAEAADGIKLKIGGYSNTLFSAGWIDDSPSRNDPASSTDYSPSGLWQNGKLTFQGSYRHDNGVQLGATVEVEIFPTIFFPSPTIEERFLWVQSDLGRVELGSNYSAAYQMHYASPVVGLPINSGWVTVFIPPNPDSTVVYISPITSTYLDFGDNENVVTYYTPRLSGFQLGISYAPAVSEDGRGQNYPVEAERETQYHNGLSVGVNYVETLGSVDLALSAGYRRAQPSNAVKEFGVGAYQAISFGTHLSYAGVTIGGSYANELEGEQLVIDRRIVRSTSGQSWDAGISYTSGDWTVGGSYFHGEIEGVPSGTREVVGSDNDSSMTAAVASLDYRLASGIHAIAGVMYGRWQAESGAVTKGVVGISGLTFYY